MARKAKNRQEEKRKGNKTSETKKSEKKDDKPKIDYEIKCLLLPISKGDVVKVNSDTFSGDIKVMGIDISDFEMTLKGKVLNEVAK